MAPPAQDACGMAGDRYSPPALARSSSMFGAGGRACGKEEDGAGDMLRQAIWALAGGAGARPRFAELPSGGLPSPAADQGGPGGPRRRPRRSEDGAFSERMLAAWTASSARSLKRCLLASWAQAARAARKDGRVLHRMLERELERVGAQCAEEARCAELLREELEQERLRRGCAWQLAQQCMEEARRAEELLTLEKERSLRLSAAPSPAPPSPPVNGQGSIHAAPPSPFAGDDLPAQQLLTPRMSFPPSLPAYSGCCTTGAGAGALPPPPLRLKEDHERSERIASAVAFLFRHCVEHRFGGAKEAYTRCRDESGCVSRRSFTGLVVEVLGTSSGAAAGLLAEVVGAVWPLLDPGGDGAVREEGFVRLLAELPGLAADTGAPLWVLKPAPAPPWEEEEEAPPFRLRAPPPDCGPEVNDSALVQPAY